MKPLKTQNLTILSFLFYLATFLLGVGSANAQAPRISEEYRKELLVDVKEGLLEYKEEFGSPLKLKKMRAEVLEYIYDFYNERVASPDEINGFVAEFDKLAQRSDLSDEQKEEALLALFNNVVDTINKSPLQCLPEGGQCNDWSCCDGLTCAAVPQGQNVKTGGGRCLPVETKCSEDSECCTGNCHEDFSTKEKSCRPKMQCYKPVKLNASCNDNPVCEEGSCLEFNLATSTILACELNGNKCSNNSQCCSGLCDGNQCQKNSICKDCVAQGQSPERGRSCCEGLMLSKEGKCIIDRPPFMMPTSYARPSLSQELLNLLFSTAHAQVDQARNAIGVSGEAELWKGGGVIRDEISKQEERGLNMQMNNMSAAANSGGNLKFQMRPRSNFETCDIDFKNDFMWGLKEKGVYNYQLTLLGFEYVALGEGTQDLWTSTGAKSAGIPFPGIVDRAQNEGANIHSTLKSIAEESRQTRRELFEKVAVNEERVRCLCYDKIGFDKLEGERKAYFKENCSDLYEDYLKIVEQAGGNKELLDSIMVEDQGDASGIKYKILFTYWLKATKDLETELLVINNNVERKLNQVGKWMQQNDWNKTEVKNIPLFTFTVKNPTGRVAVASAATAALLSAGVIVLTGGFAGAATLSIWASAGIITASAVAGGVGGWLVDSLRGAWISKAPIVQDEYVKGRENYKCGKKDRCADFRRFLRQPYNKICNKHISANACIRSFLTLSEDGKTRYLIDPWIPYDIKASTLIKDKRDYSSLLESGFNRGRSHLAAKAPGGTLSDSYLESTFVDEVAAGMFTPTLNVNHDNYKISSDVEFEIKRKAGVYAVDEGFFYPEEEGNIALFGNYVWDYHFIFPRKTLTDAIAYPPPGFVDYVELVSLAASNVVGNNIDTAKSLASVQNLALQDLATTISGFGKGTLSQAGGDVRGIVSDNLDQVKKGESRIGAGANLGLDPRSFTPDVLDRLSTSGTNGSLVGGGDFLSGESQQVQSAVASFNRIKEEREEAMKNFQEQMGDTERGKELLENQAASVKSFFAALGNSNSGTGLANSAVPRAGGAGNGASSGDDDLSKNPAFNANFNPSGLNLNGSARSNRSGFVSNGSGSASSSSNNENQNTDGASGISDADAQRMREAIEARNRLGDEAFGAKDGDTLWEIVTNTYIRVYDRLLPKRNSKLQDLE